MNKPNDVAAASFYDIKLKYNTYHSQNDLVKRWIIPKYFIWPMNDNTRNACGGGAPATRIEVFDNVVRMIESRSERVDDLVGVGRAGPAEDERHFDHGPEWIVLEVRAPGDPAGGRPRRREGTLVLS